MTNAKDTMPEIAPPVITHHPESTEIIFIDFAGVRIQLNLFAFEEHNKTPAYVGVDVFAGRNDTHQTLRAKRWRPEEGSSPIEKSSGLKVIGEDCHFVSIFAKRPPLTNFDAARQLEFGHTWDDVPSVQAAWGARLIYPNDVVHDRTDVAGDETAKAELLDYLQNVVKDQPFDKAHELRYSMPKHLPTVLFEDDVCKVVGHPHASYGYLYVTAWLKAHEETITTKENA